MDEGCVSALQLAMGSSLGSFYLKLLTGPLIMLFLLDCPQIFLNNDKYIPKAGTFLYEPVNQVASCFDGIVHPLIGGS